MATKNNISNPLKDQVSIFSKIIGSVTLLAVLVIATWLIYKIIGYTFSIKGDLGKALILSSSAVFIAFIANIWAKYLEHKNKIKFEVRQQTVKVYENLIEYFFWLFSQTKRGATVKELTASDSNEEKFQAIMRSLIFWASDDVIKAYIETQTTAKQTTEKPEEYIGLVICLGKLLMAIRKDVGPKTSLNETQLLALIITDIQEALSGEEKMQQ